MYKTNLLDNNVVTLLSVLMVTLSCGRTLSTSNFQSAASVVDSMISSGFDFSIADCKYR